ncbi:hypothetical protein G7Z17_g4869 [Cylindrodendrum hubeiense]|uniref:Uncharacterized protein n=1 Tax=Cylindrodendrum hubeiense TaxID=595255 RepID=A0A9P5L9K4_9HYPO|nr:hypothetical protein G7Z17_g4869 [Cylindrodendrum hubeiense]
MSPCHVHLASNDQPGIVGGKDGADDMEEQGHSGHNTEPPSCTIPVDPRFNSLITHRRKLAVCVAICSGLLVIGAIVAIGVVVAVWKNDQKRR